MAARRRERRVAGTPRDMDDGGKENEEEEEEGDGSTSSSEEEGDYAVGGAGAGGGGAGGVVGMLQRGGTSRYESDFRELEFLGRGGSGQVVKVRNR